MLSDYSLVKNDDGSVTVTKENGDTDTLNGIDGFWFNVGNGAWHSIEDALELAGGDAGDDDNGDDYDDDDDDNGDDYDDGDDDNGDDYDDGGGESYEGTDDDDYWNDQSGSQTYDGRDGMDQVNYKGTLSDYSLAKQDDGSVTVTNGSGDTDTLIDIEALWFEGDGGWYTTDYAIEEADDA